MSLPKGFMYFDSEIKFEKLENIQHLIETGQKIPFKNALGAFNTNKYVAHCLCLSTFIIEDNDRQGLRLGLGLNHKFVNEYNGSMFFLIFEYESFLKKLYQH